MNVPRFFAAATAAALLLQAAPGSHSFSSPTLPCDRAIFSAEALQERSVFSPAIAQDQTGLTGLKAATHRVAVAQTPEIKPPSDVEAFIENVIMPVSKQFPRTILRTQDPKTGDLLITHMETIEGRSVLFRYRIAWQPSGTKPQTPSHPVHPGENVLKAPRGPWDSLTLTELRFAWRRITIDNPKLYRRFTATSLEIDDYQEEAVQTLLVDLHRNRRAIGVMATASGKTIVALETFKRWREQKQQHLPAGQRPGVAIFFVNNTTVLDEAREKLETFYPGQFSAGWIYGGETQWDETTDIIFATPISLKSTKTDVQGMQHRLEQIMQKRRVMLVIGDEIHHMPTLTYSRIFEGVENKNKDCVYLGFTAADIRRDQGDVLAAFGNRRSFTYTLRRGQHEGFLTDIDIRPADQDVIERLNLVGRESALFKRDTDLDRRYKDVAADMTGRLGHIAQVARACMRELPYMQALYIVRKIATAQEIAAQFPADLGPTISLTSSVDDAAMVAHGYPAWKKHVWRPDSPFQNQPVPRSAITVNMFREGIDAPGANFLGLGADTDSHLTWVQEVGRVARPAVGKTHAIVADYVGITRQPKYRLYYRYLFGGTEDQEVLARLAENRPALQQKSAEPVESPAQTTTEIHPPASSGEMQRTLTSEKAPSATAVNLDSVMALRAGCKKGPQADPKAYQTFLAEVAKLFINEGGHFEELQKQLDPLFLPNHESRPFSLFEQRPAVPRNATTIRIVARLIEQLAPFGVRRDQVYALYPQLDRSNGEFLRRVGENIAYFREWVIGFPIQRCLQTMATRLDFSGPKNTAQESLLRELRDELRLADIGIRNTALAIAEDQNLPLNPDVIVEAQERAIRILLAHGAGKGNIHPEDFSLPPKVFVEHLRKYRLIRRGSNANEFVQIITPYMVDYFSLGPKSTLSVRQNSAQAAEEIVNIHRAITDRADFRTMSDTSSRKLTHWKEQFSQNAARLNPLYRPFDASLANSFSALLRALKRRPMAAAASTQHCEIHWIESNSKNVNLVQVTRKTDRFQGSFLVDSFPGGPWKHVRFSGESRWDIEPAMAPLRTLYRQLTRSEQQELVQTILKILLKQIPQRKGSREIVFVIQRPPEAIPAEAADFFSDLQRALIQSADFQSSYVIGPLIQRVSGNRSSFFTIDLGDPKECRWPTLTPDVRKDLQSALFRHDDIPGQKNAPRYMAVDTRGNVPLFKTPSAMMAAVYLAYDNQNRMAFWHRVAERLERVDANRPGATAIRSLLRRMPLVIERFPHLPFIDEILATVFTPILEQSPNTALSDLRLAATALQAITNIPRYSNPMADTFNRFADYVNQLEKAPARRLSESAREALRDLTMASLHLISTVDSDRSWRWEDPGLPAQFAVWLGNLRNVIEEKHGRPATYKAV